MEGTGLGVQRQVEDCRRLAESLGWPVAEEYVDNDLSAFKGTHRPPMSGCWPIWPMGCGTR